jgi:preprotein translocase subunit SecY
MNKVVDLVIFLVEMVALFAVVASVILLVQGTRKNTGSVCERRSLVINNTVVYVSIFHLKVNAAGVMPIIFAQAIMFIPAYHRSVLSGVRIMARFCRYISPTSHLRFGYNITFATLIILFTYFYTAISVNPSQMAEDMKKNGGFIPGVKPGRKHLSLSMM